MSNPNSARPTTMHGPTEPDLRLQAIWERAAVHAVATGHPADRVTTTMFAAAIVRMRAEMGAAALAQYLGQLAVACHEEAGCEVFDEHDLGPVETERTAH